MERWNSAYLSGLTRMASSCAAGIGPSYVDADFFRREGFPVAFAARYGTELGHLVPESDSLETVLGQWMGDRQVAERLMHWVRLSLGSPGQVYRPADGDLVNRLDSAEDRCVPFFFLEDLIFADFPEGIVCFLIGNDE